MSQSHSSVPISTTTETASRVSRTALALLFAGVTACGGPQPSPYMDGLPGADVVVAAPTPATPGGWSAITTDADDTFVSQPVEASPEEAALLASYAHETAGEVDAALAALLDPEVVWSDALSAMRWLRVYDLRNRVPGFDATVQVALDTLPIGGTVFEAFLRRELGHILAYRDYRYGLVPGTFDHGVWGAPTTWRELGPISPNAMLDARTELLDPGTLSLAEGLSLPGGDLEPELVRSDLYETYVGGNGVYVLETFVEVPVATDALVALDVGSPHVLSIDDTLVLERPVSELWGPTLHFARVHVEPGVHRVRLQMGNDGGTNVWFRFLPLDPTVEMQASAELAPAVTAGTTASDPRGQGLTDLIRVQDTGALSWILAAELAVASSDAIRAEALLDAYRDTADPVIALWVAALAGELAHHPSNYGEELALAVLRQAADQWDEDAALDVELGRRLLQAGQRDAALNRLESAARVRPDAFAVHDALADLYLDEGWGDLYRHAIRRAVTIFPTHCTTVSAVLDDMIARGELVSETSIPEPWLRCEGTQRTLAELHSRPAGDLQASLETAELLASRNPDSGYSLELLLDAQLAAGEDVRGSLEAAEVDGSLEGHDLTRYLRDLAWRDGERDTVRSDLSEAIAADPTDMSTLMLRSFLDGSALMSDMRWDGMQAVADYQAAGASYGGQAVWVLDYAAVRYFEDASSLRVTHQILQPLTRDAIGALGEVGVPDGARILTVRTIKADGTVLVPEDIGNRDAISMPNIEVGDFLELEYAEAYGAADMSRVRAVTDRFYFQVPDGTLHASIARYDYPLTWADDIVFDVRAMPDAPAVSETDTHVTRIYRADASPPIPTDPGAPGAAEWVPSVRMAYNISWDDTLEAYQDLVASVTIPTPEMVAAARAIVADVNDRRERVERIFRFVNDEFVDYGGFFSEPVTFGWRAGETDRLVMTYTLLQAIDADPELVFVRSWESDHYPQVFADGMIYDVVVLRVPVGGGQYVWLEPQYDSYPFDYMTSDAQGCEALVVTGRHAGAFVTTPEWPDAAERSTMDVVLTLRADGSAYGVITEEMGLGQSSSFRSWLEILQDEQELIQVLESSLSSSFPGARVDAIDIVNRDAAGERAEVVYSFEVPSLLRVEGDTLVFDGSIFANDGMGYFAGWPVRERDLFVSYLLRRGLDVTFEAPEGYVFAEVPADVEAIAGENLFTLDIGEPGGTALTLARTTTFPLQRIAPEDYPEFAEMVNTMVGASQMRVVLTRE